MKKIKIIYYCDTEAKRSGTGGAEIYLLTLLKNLDRTKFEPFLICPKDENRKNWRKSIRELKVKVIPAYEHKKSLFKNTKRIKHLFNKINPQIVHLQFWTAYSCTAGLLAAKLAKVPIIISTEHSFLPLDKEPKSIPLKAAFQIFRKRLIDYPTTVSYASKNMMQKKQLFFNKNIYVIHNGIDINIQESKLDNLYPIKLINKDKINIVNVGSLEKGKGQEYLIRAANKLPIKIQEIIKIHFIGSGQDKNTLKKLSRKLLLNNSVIFWGERNDVNLLLPKFDIFVFPSLMENFSLAILEAMNGGLPILASNVGGTKEALEEGKGGYLIPVKNYQYLAKKIAYLAKKPKLRSKMGRFNQELVKLKFSDKIMTEKTEKLYKDAISNCIKKIKIKEYK